MHPSRFALLLAFIISLLTQAAAQDTWSLIPSPTAQDLWGVCQGNGRFVAVGRAGTILTSKDGAVWQPQASGTTEWLLAVAARENLFVVVGDRGTVLTSADGETWTARVSGVNARLNGIACSATAVVAVGEAGTAIQSSDGVTWTALPQLPGSPGWLRAVCFDYAGRVVIGGERGYLLRMDLVRRIGLMEAPAAFEPIESLASYGSTIVLASARPVARQTGDQIWATFDGGTAYQRGVCLFGGRVVSVGARGSIQYPESYSSAPASPTLADLHAVTARDDLAIGVGRGGTIVRSVMLPKEPSLAVTVSPAYLRHPITFVATATGSQPVTYELRRDGPAGPLIGQQQDGVFRVENATAADAGVYTIVARNAVGHQSTSVDVTVQPPPAAVIDRLFPVRGDAKSGGAEPLAVATDSRGRFYLALLPTQSVLTLSGRRHSSLVRLNPDFTLDVSFVYEGDAAPVLLVPLPTGKLLLGFGPLQSKQGTVVRLNEDGSTDTGFHAAIASQPQQLLIDGAGKTTVVADGSMFRLNHDGSEDASFPGLRRPGARLLALSLTSGGYVVAVSEHEGPSTTLSRYTAQGQLDVSYPQVTLTGYLRSYPAADMVTRDAEGRIYFFTSERFVTDLTNDKVRRLTPTGQLDSSFAHEELLGLCALRWANGHLGCTTTSYFWSRGQAFGYVQLDERGQKRWSVSPRHSTLSVFRRPAHWDSAGGLIVNGFTRYTSEGVLDRGFSGRVDAVPPSSETIDRYTCTQLLPDDSLLIIGDFSEINGEPWRGIARVAPVRDAYRTRLTNLSVRTTAGAGDATLIAGFIVNGESGTRPVLARAVGPSLTHFGVRAADVLRDPRLSLFQRQVQLTGNDDWEWSTAAVSDRLGAFPLDDGSRDAALVRELHPGAYTAHVTASDGASGIALMELYDGGGVPESANACRLANVSGRARVAAGDQVLIAGFVISGVSSKRLLIRGAGPALREYGVNDVLADPVLRIHRGSEVIAENDNWQSPAARRDLREDFSSVGAFDFKSAEDAALVVDLAPGVYTAIVSGKNGAQGTALVEIYELP